MRQIVKLLRFEEISFPDLEVRAASLEEYSDVAQA